jgi:hypothetical protein
MRAVGTPDKKSIGIALHKAIVFPQAPGRIQSSWNRLELGSPDAEWHCLSVLAKWTCDSRSKKEKVWESTSLHIFDRWQFAAAACRLVLLRMNILLSVVRVDVFEKIENEKREMQQEPERKYTYINSIHISVG